MNNSPVPSCNETKPEVQFEDLWRKLRESHQSALQELEAKIAKLKKERCLDAQRLEGFHTRNQQLKEQNKSLQDTVGGLEERLRAGRCERCAILEDSLKNNEEHSASLIDKLKQAVKGLADDNKKLNAELDKLEKASSNRQRCSSPEAEDGFIPDSPVMLSSLPASNKLKKRKNVEKSKFVRYAEKPLPPAHTSLFIEAEKDSNIVQNPVLVPNTCELDASQTEGNLNSEELVAETCRLDLLERAKKENPVNQRPSAEMFFKFKFHTKPHIAAQTHSMIPSPDSTTDKSLLLLPQNKRFSSHSFANSNLAKRKKEENQLEEEKQDIPQNVTTKASQTVRPKLEQSTLLNETCKAKSDSNDDETLIESPVFKKPNATVKWQKDARNRSPVKDKSPCENKSGNSQREFKVEPMWSIDPALALEMYESEREPDEEKEQNLHPGELVDSDCTWISHSLLQGRAENGQDENCISGLGEKANDSLDRLFDTSACGDYKSYTTLHSENQDRSQEEEEEEGDREDDAENSVNRRKPGQPAFAHVAVIRKKDDRRKLKGTTCKECEIYYAHLPEEERKKKLSNCSRHRFLYIPPCTPENFWEVGFPSTQTCIERGYIKEDKNPQLRSRRRQPLSALFSPKGKRQDK